MVSVVALMSGMGAAHAVDIPASTTGATVPGGGDTIQSGVTVSNTDALGSSAITITSGGVGTETEFTNSGTVQSAIGSSATGIGANGNDNIVITNTETGIIEALGTGGAIRLDNNVTIENAGTISSAGGTNTVRADNDATITNTGTIRSDGDPVSGENSSTVRIDRGTVTNGSESNTSALIVNNANATDLDSGDQDSNVYAVQAGDDDQAIVTNYGIIRATGNAATVATGHNEGEVGAVRLGGDDSEIYNYGTIETTGVIVETDSDNQEIGDMYGIRVDGADNLVHNYGTGVITGGKHGVNIDGDAEDAVVTNDLGGTITGLNGSGVGSDSNGTVTNYGTITGTFNDDYSFGDGDGVDIDLVGEVTNYGTIQGLGSKGTKPGELSPSNSEGIAMGGGSIVNGDEDHLGALISGANNGILIDDSEGGDAFDAVTITNYGTIRGLDGYGIRLVNAGGTFDNRIDNYGAISGANGIAVEIGGGDDTFNDFGGTITGSVDAQGGADTLNIDRGDDTEYTLDGEQFLNFETTNVLSGIVTLDGDYTSSTLVRVFEDASFVGNGGVTTTTFRNEGRLAMGTATTTSTFDVTGNFVSEADSVYVVKLDDTSSDLVSVSGTATLNGGTVEVYHLSGITAHTYTILEADGGVSGTFDDLDLSPFVTASLGYGNANAVTLTIDPLADTLNGSAIADALSNARNDLGLSLLSSGEIGDALNDLAPIGSGNAAGGGVATSLAFTQQTSDHIASVQSSMMAEQGGSRLAMFGLSAGDEIGGQNGGLWMRGFGLTGSLDASAAGNDGLSYDGAGAELGYDFRLGETSLLGMSAGYARIANDMDRAGAESDVDSYMVGLYGAAMLGAMDLSGQLAYVHNEYSQYRLITFAGLTASADYEGSTFSANAELGRTFQSGNIALRPSLAIDAMRLKVDGYSETGAPGFNLTSAGKSDTLVRSKLGISARFGQGKVVPSLGLYWGHDIEQPDSVLNYAFAGLANSAFSISGNTPDRDAALINAGLDMQAGDGMTLSLAGTADLRDNADALGLSVKLRYEW
tara:strand:+ start:20477 stop:23596 length:3120 start_codon:yes stop_codon:yes gene_type:complete